MTELKGWLNGDHFSYDERRRVSVNNESEEPATQVVSNLSCESSVSVQEAIRPEVGKVLESESSVQVNLAIRSVVAAAGTEPAKATGRKR